MLDKEYQYYKKHRAELLKQYRNKFIVIKEAKIIGSYPTEREAYEDTIKKHKIGTFLIQQCLSLEKNPPKTFYSRVVFS